MGRRVTLDRLSALVRAKRGKLGLRDTAEEIGNISASTLSRIEKGKMPDLDTFIVLCEWLGIQPNDLIESEGRDTALEPGSALGTSDKMTTPEIVEAHFRADKVLDPRTAEALSEMVRAAYAAVVNGKLGSNEPQ